MPWRLQLADDGEELFDLVRRQGGGRLIHDQDAGLERQRAGDLDGLLLGDRQVAAQSVADRSATPSRGEQGARLALLVAVAQQAEPRSFLAEEKVVARRAGRARG